MAAVNQPELSKRIRDLGYTIVADQPEAFEEFISAYIEKWRKVVQQKGVCAE